MFRLQINKLIFSIVFVLVFNNITSQTLTFCILSNKKYIHLLGVLNPIHVFVFFSIDLFTECKLGFIFTNILLQIPFSEII